MGAIVDTSILIAVERGELDLESRVAADPDGAVAIAAITAAELLHGVDRLRGVRRARARQLTDRWLATLPVVPFDLEVARIHATLAGDLGRRGAPVGPHDLMIAATAVHLGYDVVTRDRRSFGRIRGLRVVYW